MQTQKYSKDSRIESVEYFCQI